MKYKIFQCKGGHAMEQDRLLNQLMDEKLRYLRLLAEKYPSIPSVCREIINLKAILNLP